MYKKNHKVTSVVISVLPTYRKTDAHHQNVAKMESGLRPYKLSIE